MSTASSLKTADSSANVARRMDVLVILGLLPLEAVCLISDDRDRPAADRQVHREHG
jgi:hypothetical protein